jgi:hypothetical protein
MTLQRNPAQDDAREVRVRIQTVNEEHLPKGWKRWLLSQGV